MATVLILDDVQDYCEEVAAALSRDGHEVVAATSADEAIEIGSLFRPDVLVSDWLLQDSVHGLEVSQVLRVVHPQLRTILISGLCSADLRRDAALAHVCEVIEKPFSLEEIRRAVRHAVTSAPPPSASTHIAFIEADESGLILYANGGAERLFEQAACGRYAGNIQELFSDEGCTVLEECADGWVELAPLSAERLTWLVRRIDVDDGDERTRIFVMLDGDHSAYQDSSVMRHLLGLPRERLRHRRLAGHFLIIDGAEPLRRAAVQALRHRECVCLAAESSEEGLRLFFGDPNIKHVVIDEEIFREEGGELLRIMRRSRPEVRVIASRSEADADMAEDGVDVLPKPLPVDDLLVLIEQHG